MAQSSALQVIGRRLLQAAPVIVLATFIVFGLVKLLPGDVAVTGFDDLPLAEQLIPRLTTISQHVADGARAMVTALFERIGGEDAPSVVMRPELIRRDTA